jgi:hypothetical protein
VTSSRREYTEIGAKFAARRTYFEDLDARLNGGFFSSFDQGAKLLFLGMLVAMSLFAKHIKKTKIQTLALQMAPGDKTVGFTPCTKHS